VGIGGYIFLGLAIVALAYAAALYNNLVRLRHNVSMAWSNIDVLLKQRHDELPNLIETCKGYMEHERETFQRVVEARNAVARARRDEDVGALGPAEMALRLGLGSLFALSEDYPELRANETFQHLQRRITQLENQIADRRELYNASVTNFNVRQQQFPDVLLARNLGFQPADLLEFDESELEEVDMKGAFD